jgi:adenylate cyclase
MSRYARDELERRFLLNGDPPPAISTSIIIDRYLHNTRLRLRRMETVGQIVFKLAKIEDLAPGQKRLTNLYLEPGEAELLAALPAAEVRKIRRRVVHEGRLWAVDCYEGGLRIAETEHDPDDQIELPPWVGREVTADAAFSGWALAKRYSETL